MYRNILCVAIASALFAAADAFSPSFFMAPRGVGLRPSYTSASVFGRHGVFVSPLQLGGRSGRAVLRPVQPSMIALGGIDTVKPLPMPKTVQPWEVHKFGGASLANAELYRTVGDLLIRESEGRGSGKIPTMAIVSAMYGVTDQLIACVNAALVSPQEAEKKIAEVVGNQLATIRELATPDIVQQVEKNIKKDAEDVMNVLKALSLIKSTPAVVMELVTGLGEVWSAQTLLAYLKTKKGVSCEWIDAREILVVSSSMSGLGEKGSSATGNVQILWEECSDRMRNWWSSEGTKTGLDKVDYSKAAPIIIVTGFVASTPDGVPTTLKRSGSDFSATIFARLINASRVTMWKNTDGVYTADPRRCLTLRERDMNQKQEDIIVSKKGAPIPIKGITSIDKVAVINLEGASIIGLSGAASRFFGAMAASDINIIMITQASSEHSICVAVPEDQGERALKAVQAAFELELERSTINSVSLLSGMSVVAIVGEGMAFTPGVSATMMKAMSTAGVNIRAIAQGSSERQVSAVVERNDVTRALRSIHNAFTLSKKVVSVAVMGATGTVGKEFIGQLLAQKKMVSDKLELEPRIVIAASKTNMIFDENGIGADFADRIEEIMSKELNPARIVIDLTASETVADHYEKWLASGINIVTANKAVSSGPMKRFKRVNAAAESTSAKLGNECNVGAALPLMGTIKDLIYTGDDIERVEGVFSGTMTYVANRIEAGASFCDALAEAVEKGYTEPDLRHDLSGLDAARKLVIIARELGMEVETSDVECQSFVPKDLQAWKPTSEDKSQLAAAFIDALKKSTEVHALENQIKAAADKGLKVRQVGIIDVINKKVKVEINEVTGNTRFGTLMGQENAIQIYSKRYNPQPLVIRGSGAGAALTASGVLADLLRVARNS